MIFMAICFIDTEFNGFGGELISLGIVPQDRTLPEFYVVIEMATQPVEWVAEHVMPFLGDTLPVSREMAARELASYLRRVAACNSSRPVLVADWPEDFAQVMNLLILGPGQMASTVDFDCAYRSCVGFNTADHSAIPHNALEDARALRDYFDQ